MTEIRSVVRSGVQVIGKIDGPVKSMRAAEDGWAPTAEDQYVGSYVNGTTIWNRDGHVVVMPQSKQNG